MYAAGAPNVEVDSCSRDPNRFLETEQLQTLPENLLALMQRGPFLRKSPRKPTIQVHFYPGRSVFCPLVNEAGAPNVELNLGSIPGPRFPTSETETRWRRSGAAGRGDDVLRHGIPSFCLNLQAFLSWPIGSLSADE